MVNPKAIETVKEGSVYAVPSYFITNDGIQDGEKFIVGFCKGNKEDDSIFRQQGYFTETLIAVAKKYLEDVNVGELTSIETSIAITKLDEALMWLNKRAEERALRGVLSTYKK